MQPQITLKKSPKNSAHNDAALDLETLEYRHEFVDRHIGPSNDQIGSMLSDIGVDSLEELVERTVPPLYSERQSARVTRFDNRKCSARKIEGNS